MPLQSSKLLSIGALPSRKLVAVGLGYVCVHVLLDWISYIEPFGPFGITPWNPASGLMLSFALMLGPRVFPALFAGPMLAEIFVHRMPAPLPVLVLLSMAISGVYGVAAGLLARPAADFQPSLQRLRDVVLLSVAALLCAGIVSALYVGILVAAGLIEPHEFRVAAIRYLIGDFIGIVVTAPVLLEIAFSRRLVRPAGEALAQFGLLVLVLYLIFATSTEPRLELFYLMFLPIIWMGLRGGLWNVSMGLAATQILVVLAIHQLSGQWPNFTSLQAMMLVLALTGLSIGIVVDERRRAELRLRLLQDAQAQMARQASFNELSAALAHEINQPLSAATTYARLAIEAMEAQGGPKSSATDAALKSLAQVRRATEVVRRLRQLMRSGQTERQTVAVSALVRDSIELAAIDRAGITLEIDIQPGGLSIQADPLQAQQLLINLLRNAAEAMAEGASASPRIRVVARRGPARMVAFLIEDTGPGFREEQIEQPFEPFTTTKVDGLGIGLSLCRTIIRAHGGEISIASSRGGGAVRFSLPEAVESDGEEEDLRRSDRR